jgi:DNA-binding FadR family transcriptional regulator
VDARDRPFASTAESRRRGLKTSELVARDFVMHIITARLEPGARLPTESEMVETLQVGRTTLREALRLLETRGVITIRSGPRGGPVVRRPRASDLGEALMLILRFEGASLANVLDARAVLETMVARLAARRITKRQLEVLDETVKAILGHIDDHNRFLAENQRFHTTIAEAAGNVVLRVFAETVKVIGDGAVFGIEYTSQRRRAVAEAHARIIEALRAGNEDAAEQAMKEHLEEAGKYWHRRYGDLILQPVQLVR